jgi:hypothetical protein
VNAYDLLDDLRRDLKRAEDDARYWREAYFEHIAEEHPEIVEKVLRKMRERAET